MAIYDEIKKKFILPKAFEEWKDFRKNLTDIIIDIKENEGSKSVSVIGAGPCNDVDLHRLCSSFEAVTLIDCDAAAMGVALGRLTNPEIWKMNLIELSLTGIKEKDISLFCENTLSELRKYGRKLTASDFYMIFENRLDELGKKMIVSGDALLKKLPKRDIVVCNGVFSQLFSTISFFIRSCAASMPDNILDEIEAETGKLEEKLREFSRKLVPIITEAIVRSAQKYAVFGNEYSEINPVEGACRCISAIRKNEEIVRECTALWDFNRTHGIRYDMLIQVVKGRT
ncbi:MAG: hypothetical protein IKP88_13850 [Lachnospiraceae bacterium]|nr:hypothetical protein [Lachnospiraceae bacterium]